MKKLLTIILLSVSFLGYAQSPEFFGGIEYFPKNSIKVKQDYNQIIYDRGDLNLLVGIRYNPIDILELKLQTDTYMNPNTLFSYTPVAAEYRASITVQVSKKVRVSINHACFHPLQTDKKEIVVKKYGGYTKISLTYNMK